MKASSGGNVKLTKDVTQFKKCWTKTSKKITKGFVQHVLRGVKVEAPKIG